MAYELITPEIDMQLEPMAELPKSVQGKICKCPVRCERYAYLDGYGRYCENTARNIALSLFALIEGIARIQPNPDRKLRWSTKEESFLREWKNKRGGFKYGDTRLIAAMLDRPYDGVRHKIKQMQRDGLL